MKQFFPYGKPVTGKELINREEIIDSTLGDIEGGQSIILASPRRYGKSSIILEIYVCNGGIEWSNFPEAVGYVLGIVGM
ncbi:unnamed protein product [marine sediment metagenome]|uniref:ATPase domain-containing protein n=1 Tax=marine sediment metagenome TaxID=412755 RepID=X1SAH0_9ZZZZ